MKSTSALTTKSEQQKIAIEKLKFALTIKVDTLEKILKNLEGVTKMVHFHFDWVRL
jgi:hypothetical protein